jgi:hypothetical protein
LSIMGPAAFIRPSSSVAAMRISRSAIVFKKMALISGFLKVQRVPKRSPRHFKISAPLFCSVAYFRA